MELFRRPFRDVVERQLALFEEENARELAAIGVARSRAGEADVDDAEEAFGDLRDLLDWAAGDLRAFRDAYAASLEPGRRHAYERAFTRAVRRRLPALLDAFVHDDA